MVRCMNHAPRSAPVLRQSLFLSLPALVCTAWLTGCTAHHVQVDGSWQEDVPHDLSFTRLLVVGISHDINVRCDFEHFMKTQLSSESTRAFTSCSKMSLDDDQTVEGIDAAVQETQADAVLATILVASHLGTDVGGKDDTRGGGYYKATGWGYEAPYYGTYSRYGGYGYYGGYGRYGVPVTYFEFRTAPVITTVDGEVAVANRLFDTRDATMVYEVIVTADDLQSRDSAFATLTAPVAEHLRHKGLVK